MVYLAAFEGPFTVSTGLRIVDEPDVLQRLRSGDPATIEDFWHQERPRVRALCVKVLGPGPDAEDLADEVLVDVMFVRVHSIQHTRALRTYLRLMAVRRAQRRHSRRNGQDPTDNLVDNESTPADDIASDRVLLERLPQCLAQLTPKAQDALRLRYQGELTTEAIGRLLGGSKQYIGKLLKKSQQALRICLEQGVRK